jgi:hypothetical protein
MTGSTAGAMTGAMAGAISPTVKRRPSAALAAALALLLTNAVCGAAAANCSASLSQQRIASKPEGALPAAEFARIIEQFSEPGGEFGSDNLTSNERRYLEIVPKLKELKVSGGAYLGVGPEQNFTYIAKVRPRIAFIVDIRRAAVVQHLMYKAIFHHAATRAEFLAWLFSKPAPEGAAGGMTIEALLEYMRDAPSTREQMLDNLVVIRKTIEEDFCFPLTADDDRDLQSIYTTFWRDNLTAGFRFGHGPMSRSYDGFPDLAGLITATDQDGRRGNFLTSDDDYRFVRNLEERNLVIPVVGNFGGAKAFAAIAEYLRTHGYRLRTFYTSNVEEYLFEEGIFSAYAANVCRMPLAPRSVIIRVVRSRWAPHSFWAPRDRITPFLEDIATFCADQSKGLYHDYYSLVTTHFIAGKEPLDEALPSPAPPPAPILASPSQ